MIKKRREKGEVLGKRGRVIEIEDEDGGGRVIRETRGEKRGCR